MTIDLVRLSRRSFWIFLAVLISFFVVTGSYVGYQQHEMIHSQAKVEARYSLNMMSSLIVEPLSKGDYVTVGQFLNNWGAQRGDVVSIQLVSNNGFELARFERGQASIRPMSLASRVQYGRGGEASLMLVMDGEPTHKVFLNFVMQSITCILIGFLLLGFLLWRTLQRTAINPLKNEISSRVAAELALRESEKKFRSVIESTPLGVFFCELTADDRLLIKGTNPAVDAVLGPDCQALVGKDFGQMFPGLQSMGIIDAFKAVARSGTPWKATELHCEDCPFCEAFGVHAFQTAAGRITLFFEDMSERRRTRLALQQSESRFRALVENAADPLFVHDLKGNVLTVNRQACLSLGYSADELKALTVFDIEQGANRDKAFAFWSSMVLGESLTVGGEHTRKDGSCFPVEVRLTKFMVDDEPLVQAFIHDVSERKREEAGLLAAKIEAERANLAKSEFLSRMSHELRTPMNAILGFGQLLEYDTTQPLCQEHLESVKEILKAGNHLLGLIDDVLDISRIESDNISLSIEKVRLGDVIQACMSLIKMQAEQANVRLIVDMEQFQGVCIEADFVRIKQVLLNLLSNAVKYNKVNGSVTLGCHRLDSEKVRLTVQDSGIGLSEQQLQNLYQPFDRLGAEVTAVEGTGIGLVITKRLLELMGGSISVESALGLGTCFTLELKLATVMLMDQASDAEQATVLLNSGHQKRVLYIEDNPANLRLVERLLKRLMDCEFMAANSPVVGLEYVLNFTPDLVLLDINLPEMNGFEVLGKMRASDEARDIPVIAISANAMPRDIARAKQAGFDGYIVKPIDVKEFYQVVDQYLSV